MARAKKAPKKNKKAPKSGLTFKQRNQQDLAGKNCRRVINFDNKLSRSYAQIKKIRTRIKKTRRVMKRPSFKKLQKYCRGSFRREARGKAMKSGAKGYYEYRTARKRRPARAGPGF